MIRAPVSSAGVKDVDVVVKSIVPQLAMGFGALLCFLLCGTSVQAKPVVLRRGRSKRAASSASEPSNSGRRLFFLPGAGLFLFRNRS